MLTPVAPPGAEIPHLEALWTLLHAGLGFCWKAVEAAGGGFLHGMRAVAEHWPLLTVIFLAGLLVWLAWPVFSALFPRLAAWLWPHLPITLGLLAFWGGVFALGVHLNFYLWTGAKTDWKQLAEDVPRVDLPRHDMTLGPLDWLWPWLPSLVALLALLWLAARYFSRRCFHALCATFLLSLLFGVATHKEREEPTRPVPEAKVTDLVADRFGDRILNPLFHFDNTQPDLATLVLFGLGLMVGYMWLDRINLRQSLQPIRVTCVEDVDKKSRPDLEHLMRECLHRNTPHVPSPLPGGGLIYWQDFVEQQYTKDSHWFTRAATLVARVLRQPRGMEITSTLIQSREDSTAFHAPQEDALKPQEKFGIRIHMVDVYSRQTLMARTFWSTDKVEHAVEQAAYSAMQRALQECGGLPEWAYWHEDDGQAPSQGGAALRDYHEGVVRFCADSGDPRAVSEAVKHFKAAAWRSPGSALARLQLGKALEASNHGEAAVEIYLDLINRFPHLLMARFRLASVCRAVERWQKNLASPMDPGLSGVGKDSKGSYRWEQLQVALFTRVAAKMLRPNLLKMGKAWAEGKTGALGDFLKGWPAKLTQQDPEQLTDMMLVMANKSLRELEKAGRWRVLFWSLKNSAERRLFWRTVLWPPRLFRASYLTVKAARRCVQLRQLDRWKAGGSRPNRLLRTVLHEMCLFRTWLLALEARASVRLRGHSMGNTHYQLACFYSLRMRDEGAQEGLAKEAEQARAGAEQAQQAAETSKQKARDARKAAWKVWRAATDVRNVARNEVFRTKVEAWDAKARASRCEVAAQRLEAAAKKTSELARDATEHLSFALRDPDGPFSTGTLKWLVNHVDLEPLRRHPSFEYWSRLFHMDATDYKKAMLPT